MAQLTLVAAILRQKLCSNAPEDFAFAVSDFLIADMSLPRACQLNPIGSLSLLDLVWTRSRGEINNKNWTVAKLFQTDPHYRSWAFTKALVQAVSRGDSDVMQWLLRRFPECAISNEVVIEAARAGRLGMLQYFASLERLGTIEWCEAHLNVAAENGHWEFVRWLFPRANLAMERKRSNRVLVQSAIRQNNLDQVKWAIANGFRVKCSFPDNISLLTDCPKEEWATRAEIFLYVLSSRKGNTEKIAMCSLLQAASYGDLDYVRWIICHYIACPGFPTDICPIAAACAARHDHISVVKWFFALSSFKCDASAALFVAADNGHFEVVQWIIDRYPRSSRADIDIPCNGGNHYFYEPGSDLRPCTAIEVAAWKGYLGIVQCLHEADATERIKEEELWGQYGGKLKRASSAIDCAAANGHLEIVQWLHNKHFEGCTTQAMEGAALNGHFEVVQWLHWNRCEGCDPAIVDKIAERCFTQHYLRGVDVASTNASRIFDQKMLAMVQWFHANRLVQVTTSAMDAAASNGKLEMVKWLHSNTKAGCTAAAMDGAASNGHLDAVKWLHENRSEGCTTAAMEGAASNGYLDVMKWLSAYQPEHFSSRAIVNAATGGHLQAVRWLIEHDTERTYVVKAMIEAILHGHFEISLFLHALNVDGYSDNEVQSLTRASHADGSFEVLQNWCEVNLRASASGYPQVLT